MAVYVIVAVASLFIAMAIGGSKGFAGTGAILGGLLGPLGVLIVACMKPTIQIQAQRAEAVEAARANLRTQQAPTQQDATWGTPTPSPTSSPAADPWGDAPTRTR